MEVLAFGSFGFGRNGGTERGQAWTLVSFCALVPALSPPSDPPDKITIPKFSTTPPHHHHTSILLYTLFPPSSRPPMSLHHSTTPPPPRPVTFVEDEGRKIVDEGRKDEKTKKEMTKGGDEGQNSGRKDECSRTKDPLNSCKLNLLKNSKISGEDLTSKLQILRTKFSQSK